MNSRGINTIKNELLQTISTSDTISQFMEKCNNNFSKIVEWKGGPEGADGEKGDPGVPTKPKVPIHVWIKDKDYDGESSISSGTNKMYEIHGWKDDELNDAKYQDGHLIILENAHVYILEADKDDNYALKPKFILALQSYNSSDVVNGQPGYVHFAYANSSDGTEDFITDQDLRKESGNTEPVATFSLRRDSSNNTANAGDRAYMGVYSDNSQISPSNPQSYTWIRIQGNAGETGPQGPTGETGAKGDPGDGYTGHPYTIDLEGDLATISIGIDGKRLYDDDSCECTLHAYYGNVNVALLASNVTIGLPDGYKNMGDYIASEDGSKVGQIIKSKKGNDVVIEFTPDKDFAFPKKTIIFPLHVQASITDEYDGKTYEFDRDTIWMIKGISSTFELEIQPQYRTIKLFDDGEYYPEKLLVNVYKVEDGERTIFNFNQNPDFKLLYKNFNDDDTKWMPYLNDGVSTDGVSCLEFKVIRYSGSGEPEMWDYEDVWVVADGKDVHYYHADLGNTESMMVLTTGEKNGECATLRSESYSITFEPKFYDGTEELKVVDINIGNNSGEEYYANGTFERILNKEYTYDNAISGNVVTKSTFTITKVPYGVEVIPMNFSVTGKAPVYDKDGETIIKYEDKFDTVSFNVYISTLTNTYSLVPSVSSYNLSTGKDKDTIGCSVYKNNTLIETGNLDANGLKLKYVVHDGGTNTKPYIDYTEPLVYGDDNDTQEDEFTAKDVAIVFVLEYNEKEIVRSTVPLVKDGTDGKDGDSWQYIFCRSSKYPFNKTGISDPSTWTNTNKKDSNSEYLGEKESNYSSYAEDERWYDDHKGIDSIYRYEYQSYRKWDKEKKEWGKYGAPTLYSNFSESGSGYSVLLSNPMSVIPVGEDDWNVNENNKNQSDSTLVYLYNNTSDMSTNANVTISIPDNEPHFKAIKEKDGVNKVTFTPVLNNGSIFNFGSNTQYKLPITLTYTLSGDGDGDSTKDNFSTTVNWTLTPIKGLNDVEVFVDKRVVNITNTKSHTLKVGYYSISSNGTKTFIGNRTTGNNKGYKIILTNDIENLSSEVSVWENATYDFSNKNCYVVLVDSEGNKLDYINVVAVSDGEDGKSAIHLELTQDYISVPCSADGSGVHPEYKSDIRSQMKLYNGDKLIENGITYSFKVDGKTNTEIKSSDGSFDIPTNIITGDINIECIATYNKVSYHKILTIDLENTPYELELNKSILIRDANNSNKLLDKEIIVRVKYWMDGKWSYTDKGTVKASTTNENYTFREASGNNFERVLNIEGTNLDNSDEYTEVRISYYDEKNKEISYETIGIISNGKNGEKGSAPSCTAVEILGYSLTEEDINDEDKWVKSLDDLEGLTVGAKIYILNKYHWDDNTQTKGITVTLAGTQGNDGKSRVLFYLGSFENTNGKTPTLTDDIIYGKLTDDRCDYYVDVNGKAWMRTGTLESADGSKYGNVNDPNWKESETVGFLKAGAISADMINTGSLVADEGFINNLKITNANISEKLTADQIDATNLKVKSANIEGELTASQIDATNLKVKSANIVGELTASQIAADAITGKTIKSDKKIDGTNDATWQINNDGDGWLAKKNIYWDEDGNLSVSGTIKGAIGEMGDVVSVDGDLIIKNNNNTTTVLSGEHKYENPLDKEHTKNRNITISSGLHNTLYTWKLLDDAQVFAMDDGESDSILEGFIPTQIYTKYNFEDSKNGTDVAEIYYEYEKQLFVWVEYDYAKVYSKTVTKNDNNELIYNDGAYINVTYNSIKYKYTFVEEKDGGIIDITNDIEKQVETADTNIFSDGSIYTNSIIANDGQFYGSIDSDGVFRGELNNVTGSIKNSTIKNSDVTLSNNNKFILTNFEYKSCTHCSKSYKLLKSYSNEQVDFGNGIKLSCGEFAYKIKNICQAFSLTGTTSGSISFAFWNAFCSKYLSVINYGSILNTSFGYLVCTDTTKVENSTNEELNPNNILPNTFNINTLCEAGFGEYPIGIFHTLLNPMINVLLMSKTLCEKFNNDESAVSTEIVQMLPSLSISGNAEKSKINGYSWSHQEKNSKSTYTKTHSAILGRLSVTANTKLKIGKISISMTGYQPRKGEYYKTYPVLQIYWRYVGKYTESDKNEIGKFYSSNTTKTNMQYKNRQCTWVGAVNETKVQEFDITENGDIEIVAHFSADCTGKQLWDYPYISFSTSIFECETTSSYNAANNTITITKSGIIIKAPDGGTLSTVGGELAMLSENLKYGLKVSNDGVEICKDGSWSKL